MILTYSISSALSPPVRNPSLSKNISFLIHGPFEAEEKAKVVDAAWMKYLNAAESHLAKRMIWRKVFGRTSVLKGWWCEPDDHTFLQSIHSANYSLCYSSFSLDHPGAKWLMHPFPNQRRPLPSFPSVWFLFYALRWITVQQNKVIVF